MNNRQRAQAILNYQSYDRMPVVHFGFWDETLALWAEQGHITPEEARTWGDGNASDEAIGQRLGFDFNWYHTFGANYDLNPYFERKVLEVMPDGARKVFSRDGVVIIEKDDATGIPTEIDHHFKGRKEWEEDYKPRLQWSENRLAFTPEQLEYVRRGEWETPLGLMCGSLYGRIRDWTGMINLSYLQADDPDLFSEMIDTVGELCFTSTQKTLEVAGDAFDFGHFWEDICYRAGPLVNPRVFRNKVGPHYRRITDLLHSHGITLVSVDCDGKIDDLVPIWLENGVNVMFPIEVGIWNASIAPWRAKYGPEVRGVGGVDKKVFAYDYAAIDAEVERQKALVDLGGYIPCPDHRLPPNSTWENVQYYCERMHQVFG
jgi:uroporphyrinogen decarboxylase